MNHDELIERLINLSLMREVDANFYDVQENARDAAAALRELQAERERLRAPLERARWDINKTRTDIVGKFDWRNCDCVHCEISAALLADIDEVLK